MGCDPKDPFSVLRVLEGETVSNGRGAITFSCVTDKEYRVKSASDLVASNWAELEFSLTEGGGWRSGTVTGVPGQIVIYVNPSNSLGFYRFDILR